MRSSGADGRSWLLPVLLIAAAVAPFALTLGHELVWDDHFLVGHVLALAEDGGLAGVLSAPFLPHDRMADRYYRPLVYGSLWLDSRLAAGRAAAWPYHLTNVLLHAVVALLTALLGRRLAGSWTAGLAAGLLFAVHPARVESVAFVSGRTDILAAVFVLAAVLATLSSSETGDPARRATLLGLGCCAVAAACLSKETAFILPGVLMVLGLIAPTHRRRSWGAAPAYALTAAAMFGIRSFVVAADHAAASLLLQEPAAALAALVKMLRLVLVPWPHNALIGREHLALTAVDIAAAGALLAGLALLGTRQFERVGLLGLSWLLAFLAPALLVPASGQVLAAERYLYLPSIGVCLAAGHAFDRVRAALPAARRPLAWSALALVAVALGTGALLRSRVWRDDVTLSADLVRTAPNTALAHSVHGQALLAAEHYPEAAAALQRAVELAPDHPGTHNDLAIALWRLGRPAESAAAYRASLRLDPTRSSARQGLAYACHVLGDLDCVRQQRAFLAGSDPAALQELDAAIASGGR